MAQEAMDYRPLTTGTHVKKIRTHADSYLIVGKSIKAFNSDRHMPFKIYNSKLCTIAEIVHNTKLNSALGITKYEGMKKFLVGGSGTYRIYAICLSSVDSSGVETLQSGNPDGGEEIVKNERELFFGLACRAVRALPEDKITYMLNCKYECTKFLKIYSEDFQDFTTELDLLIKEQNPGSPDRWVFYREGHDLNIDDKNEFIDHIASMLVADPEEVNCIQVGVGITIVHTPIPQSMKHVTTTTTTTITNL